MPQLTISKKDLGNETILLEPVGCLDAHTFEKMEQAIRGLFKEKVYRIIFFTLDLRYLTDFCIFTACRGFSGRRDDDRLSFRWTKLAVVCFRNFTNRFSGGVIC